MVTSGFAYRAEPLAELTDTLPQVYSGLAAFFIETAAKNSSVTLRR